MNRIIEHIAYAMLVCMTRALGSLPQKLGMGISVALGSVCYKLICRRREVTLENIRHAYPEKSEQEVNAIGLAVFQNMGKLFYELCWSTCLQNDELLRHVKVSGLAHIRKAYAKGKGVLVLTGHFGNWEMMPVVGKLIGYPCSFVYRPLDAAALEKFLVKTRTRYGGDKIPKRRSFRKILKFLEKKGLVFLLMDQNVSLKAGVFAPFFNRPACTNKGLALLALKTGAPVLPIFLVREETGFKGLILPEVPLVNTGNKENDIEANTLAYNQVIESVVRQYPEQWFWAHRRWKTRLPEQKKEAHAVGADHGQE